MVISLRVGACIPIVSTRRRFLYERRTTCLQLGDVVSVAFDYSYEVGRYRGRPYQIGVRVDPSFDDVHSFAVVLFFRRRDAVRIEIAKVDDTEHVRDTEPGGDAVHVDRYYRADGADAKDFSVQVASWHDAEAYLADNWRRFAARYEENHGTDSMA